MFYYNISRAISILHLKIISSRLDCLELNMENLKVITSNKGEDKVCFNGHMYTKKHVGKSVITWRCINASLKCKGTQRTEVDLSNPTEGHGYTHESSHVTIAVNECKNEMKRKAQESLDKPN